MSYNKSKHVKELVELFNKVSYYVCELHCLRRTFEHGLCQSLNFAEVHDLEGPGGLQESLLGLLVVLVLVQPGRLLLQLKSCNM